MADFNFYLNRQGSRGLTGEKGDTGFSPIISVLSDTATEYILNIQNETTSFQTPNLRPPVAEGEGSYVRVNELGNWYIGEPSLATQEEVGMVQLSDIIDANDDRTAVTPNLVVDYVDSHIQDLDSNLVHKTGTESINGEKTFNNRAYFHNGFTNQGVDLWFRKDNSDTARIATTTGGIYVIPSSGKKFYYGTAEVATKTDINTVQNKLNTTNTKVTSLENGITSLVGRTNVLEAEISTETISGYKRFISPRGTEILNGLRTSGNITIGYGGTLYFHDNRSNQIASIITDSDGINFYTTSGKTVEYNGREIATKSDVNIVQENLNTTNTKVTSLENGITSLVGRTNVLEAEISTETSVRYSADSQLQSDLDAERREREIQDASLQGQLDSKLTVDNIKAGSNITLTKDGNSITISSTGGGGGSGDVTAAGNNVFTGTNTFKQIIVDDAVGAPEAEWVNNRVVLKYTYDKIPYLDRTFAGIAYVTIDGSQIPVDVDPINVKSYLLHQYSVEGSETIEVTQTDKGIQLSANLDEIGGEVNALANRVSTNETAIESLDERVTDLEESGSGIAKFPNATIFGEPTIQAGQVSNLINGNYLQFPFALEHRGRAWECNLCFTTHLNDVSTQQNIIDSRCSIALAVRSGRLVLALSSNGTTFDIGEFTMSQIQISPHTTYYVKITYQPTVGYTMKADTKEIDDSSPTYVIGYPNTPIASTLMTISSPTQPFYGSINLNNWDLYVEDLLVWQGMDDVGLSTRLDTNLSNVSEIGKQTIKDIVGSTGAEYVAGEGIIIKDGMETIDMVNSSKIEYYQSPTKKSYSEFFPSDYYGCPQSVNWQKIVVPSIDGTESFEISWMLYVRNANNRGITICNNLTLSNNNSTWQLYDGQGYVSLEDAGYNLPTQCKLTYDKEANKMYFSYRASSGYNTEAWKANFGEWKTIELRNAASHYADNIRAQGGIMIDVSTSQNCNFYYDPELMYFKVVTKSAPKSINADKQFIKDNTSSVDVQEALELLNGGDSTLINNKADKAEVQAELEGKADISFSNINDAAKAVASGLSFPSDRFISMELGASGTSYTAPANGWFYLQKTPTATGQTLYLWNKSKTYGTSIMSSTTTNLYRLLIPVREGDVCDVTYSMAGTGILRFIYAEGAN